ncbi:MAG: hypothetical protein SFU98_17565 [Leptospiraceae bacterium]|nr:hypothetical protein [Leptospiraceae bacterium]
MFNTLKLFIGTILIVFTTQVFSQDKVKKGFKLYKGAYFSIQYPEKFKVNPLIKNSGIETLYDGAFFISPDKKVKFYVYSPQWSGSAPGIDFDSKNEKKVDVKEETKNGINTKWYTYARKDGSWTRSYQEVVNNSDSGHTVHVIGIEYADQESYKKYKSEYLTFKKSLQQFAD